MQSFWIRRTRMLGDSRYRELLLMSCLLGLLVGLFSVGFTLLWKAMGHAVWDHLSNPLDRIWVSATAGLIIGLILHWLWDPGTMATIVHHYHRRGGLPMNDNGPILPVSLVGLTGGQSAGPEGALTQAGGSLGTWLSRVCNRPRFCRLLTLAGMGAGFGAFLGAPIGGAILWLEMLHDRGLEYYEAIIPTLIASSIGYLTMVLLIGQGVVAPWPVEAIADFSGYHLLTAVVVAAACGPVVMFYATMFRYVGKAFTLWRVPIYVHTTTAGLIIGGLGVLFPLSYFYGGGQMLQVMQTPLPLAVLAGLLLAKMLAASVTIRGHWQGGLIIPHLLMGAIVGKIFAMLVPGLDPTLSMLAAMAAFNAAATQTPLASAMIVLALTGFGQPVPIFLASLTGFLAGQRIRLIDNKQPRTRRPNFHLPNHAGQDI